MTAVKQVMLRNSTVGILVCLGAMIIFELNAAFGFLADGIGKSMGYVCGADIRLVIFVGLRALNKEA